MIKSRSLILKLARKFPYAIAKKHHDHVGMMIGPLPLIINSILLCLDLDAEVMKEVRIKRPDLIITHHPFFYGSKIKILKTDELKSRINDELIKMKIAVYALHTNFDEAPCGMNDVLAATLDLIDVYQPEIDPMMRIGYLKTAMRVEDFAKYVTEKLNLSYALLIDEGVKKIKKVAIIGGGGARYFDIARNEGADIYISGDAAHYIRRDIVNKKYNYLDVPHEVERVFMKTMKDILLQIDESLQITIVDHERTPKVIH